MAAKADNRVLARAIERVMDLDVPALRASVKDLRHKNPGASKKALAKKVFSKARWKATAAGVAFGLPANPWVSIPAAIGDMAVTLQVEVLAAAKVALLYDKNFFNKEDAQWELLVPVFGINAASQVMREFGVRGGMGVTRVAIKKYLSKETLKQFKKVMWKYFGLRVTQKGIITKTLPIVGGIIGGVWNWGEVASLRDRTIRYFEGKPI